MMENHQILIKFAIVGFNKAHQMLEEIRDNIMKLIALYESERAGREALAREIEQKNAEINSYRKQISDLERQVDNLKLTEAFTAPAGSSSAAREKIDRLITEMDRCISLLEK